MMRKIGFVLCCASGLFSTNALATTTHLLTPGLSIEFQLAVNDPQVFKNAFIWPLKATCTIISKTADNPINIKVLQKNGSVNGINLAKGDTMDLITQPGDKLHITAVPKAEVQLENKGKDTIKAICSADR